MRAGFAETDVTPPVGVYLAGYPGRNEPSKGVDDPLFLRVVALEDDHGERFVLVTGDLLKFPRNMAWRTKMWAEQRLGLSSASLIINLSHTHAAPGLFIQRCYPQWAVDIEYVRRFEQALREGIESAVAALRPMSIRFGVHRVQFGVSRRVPDPERPGKVRMGPYDDGVYDPEMPVFAFYEAGCAEPRGILYSHACHPTSKSSLNISADYPGQISAGLKGEFGSDVVTAFAQGAGASTMPRMRLRDNEPEYRRYWAAVAADIAEFVREGDMGELCLQLSATEKEFALPYDLARMPSQEELLKLAGPEDAAVEPSMRPANRSIVRLWAQDMLEMIRTETLPTGFRMHATRIALAPGLQLIGLSGEVTAEVGRMIKDSFGDTQTVFLGYCSYTDAYIPTASMLGEEGHEALASLYFHVRPAPFVAEIDEILTREVSTL